MIEVHVSGTQVRLCLAGAALDTGNLGVSALGLSVLSGVLERLPQARIIHFDNGRGRGPMPVDLGDGSVRVQRQGAWFSKRLHRPESIISGAARAAVGARGNMNVRAMAEADAVLDISGGDSFSDIYGPKRFGAIALPKWLALHVGTPLLLLPQTYGPFDSPATRAVARDLIRRADRAWARDPESYRHLSELMADQMDPARHLEGVDVTFALPTRRPDVWPPTAGWREDDQPLAGINVSGLLCNQPDSTARFGLVADVFEATVQLVQRLLAEEVRVVLVPHVRGGSLESDDVACARVLERTDPGGGRVQVLPPDLGARETKWFIATTDWMIGARMHATIAALSSGVPAAGVAYSDKFAGVFDRCGVGDQVLDARVLSTGELVEAAWAGWQGRQGVAERLHRTVPGVSATADRWFDDLADHLRLLA